MIEARNKGLPVFFGDVSRPEVLRSFHLEKSRAVVVTTNESRATNRAVITLRKLYPDLPIYARATDRQHQSRLSKMLNVFAMVPIMPEDSALLSLPFGGRLLRKMGISAEEVDMLLEDMRKKALAETFGVDEEEEESELLDHLGKTLKPAKDASWASNMTADEIGEALERDTDDEDEEGGSSSTPMDGFDEPPQEDQ